MTNDTNTLDARIRAKALKELEARVLEAARPLKREVGNCLQSVCPGLHNEKGEPLRVDMALIMVVKAIVVAQTTREQDNAVQNFITKVDRLQEQLDELSQHIDN